MRRQESQLTFMGAFARTKDTHSLLAGVNFVAFFLVAACSGFVFPVHNQASKNFLCPTSETSLLDFNQQSAVAHENHSLIAGFTPRRGGSPRGGTGGAGTRLTSA